MARIVKVFSGLCRKKGSLWYLVYERNYSDQCNTLYLRGSFHPENSELYCLLEKSRIIQKHKGISILALESFVNIRDMARLTDIILSDLKEEDGVDRALTYMDLHQHTRYSIFT